MIKNSVLFISIKLMVAGMLLVTGCATTTQDWTENGTSVGVIKRKKQEYGEECTFINKRKQTVKVEHRDHQGAPVLCKEGYAVKHYRYEPGRVVITFHKPNTGLICNTNGYACMELLGERGFEIFLKDEDFKPASANFLGEKGVARICFANYSTPLMFPGQAKHLCFYDAGGNLIKEDKEVWLHEPVGSGERGLSISNGKERTDSLLELISYYFLVRRSYSN